MDSSPTREDDIGAQPPSLIRTPQGGTRPEQPATPSTLGEGSSATAPAGVTLFTSWSPTRAAARARAAAAQAAAEGRTGGTSQSARATLPELSDSEQEEDSKDDEEFADAAEGGADEEEDPAVLEVVTAVQNAGPTRRQYDTSVRDQVRSYFTIVGDGSYERGGVFVCTFCKKKKYKWNSPFNISVAKYHLVSQCEACPKDIEDWVKANQTNCAGYTKEKLKMITALGRVRGNPKVITAAFDGKPSKQVSASGSVCGSAASSTHQSSISAFVRPNFLKSSLSPDKGHAIIMAQIEMFLCFFDSPVRVRSPASVHALMTACGTGITRYIPKEHKVWDFVKTIDSEAQAYMVERLMMEPGNLTIGFDGVTALGKAATLYTFSKGAISLFLTIR